MECNIKHDTQDFFYKPKIISVSMKLTSVSNSGPALFTLDSTKDESNVCQSINTTMYEGQDLL